jgi:hypothetical protein
LGFCFLLPLLETSGSLDYSRSKANEANYDEKDKRAGMNPLESRFRSTFQRTGMNRSNENREANKQTEQNKRRRLHFSFSFVFVLANHSPFPT